MQDNSLFAAGSRSLGPLPAPPKPEGVLQPISAANVMKDMIGETWIEMLPNPWMCSIACMQRIQASLCAYIRLNFELFVCQSALISHRRRTILLDRYGSDDLSSHC